MLCAVLRRAYDWFSGLHLAQKALALLFAGLFLFSLSYLLTTTVLSLAAGDRADSPVEEGAAPNTGPRQLRKRRDDGPRQQVEPRRRALGRPEGRAEGDVEGDVSSVHCDLLEGAPLGGPHGGGIARWGRGWTGRIAPSPRSSSRPRETGVTRAGG